jgi:hypothetical protein
LGRRGKASMIFQALVDDFEEMCHHKPPCVPEFSDTTIIILVLIIATTAVLIAKFKYKAFEGKNFQKERKH